MLPESVRSFLAGRPLAHVVTLDPDGSPHVSMAWVGVEGDDSDELVIGTLFDQHKLGNLRRDPRLALSFEAPGRNAIGLSHYLVIHGRAVVTEGGAAALLQRLARTYLGSNDPFPPMPNPPAGFVVRIAPDRLAGIGPWRTDGGTE